MKSQSIEVPKLSTKDLNFIYTYITSDLLNSGTVGLLTEPLIFQQFDANNVHISVYPILEDKDFVHNYKFFYKKDSLFNIYTPKLKKIKIKSQIKTIYRDKEPVDSLSKTIEKNCIAKLGFGNMYFDGKYFYQICALEAFPIGYDLNNAWCIYKFRKMPSNGLIYFIHRYASIGFPGGFNEFELTFLYPSYKDRL